MKRGGLVVVLLLTLAAVAWLLLDEPVDGGASEATSLAPRAPDAARGELDGAERPASAGELSVAELEREPQALVGAGLAPDDVAAAPALGPSVMVNAVVREEHDVPVNGITLRARWIDERGNDLPEPKLLEASAPGSELSLQVPRPAAEAAAAKAAAEDASSNGAIPADDEAARWLELELRAPGFVDVVSWARVPGDLAALSFRAVLRSGARLRGRIVDATGAPLAGAYALGNSTQRGEASRATLEEPRGLLWFSGTKEPSGSRERPGSAVRQRRQLLTQAAFFRTDGDGRFEVGPFVSGAVSLRVGHQGYIERTLSGLELGAADSELGDVVLDGGRALDGVVLDTHGEPVKLASITSRLVTVDGRNRAQHSAHADVEGVFRLEGLEPGEHEIWARRDTRSSEPRFVQVPRVDTLTLVLPATCEGRLLFDSDMPLPENVRPELTLLPRVGDEESWQSQELKLELQPPTGALALPFVSLETLGAERARVRAVLPGYLPAVVERPACGEDVVAVLRRAPQVSGRFVNTRGEPLAGLRFQFGVSAIEDAHTWPTDSSGRGRPPTHGATSDADGRWSVPHWGPGRYQLWLHPDGFLRRNLDVQIDDFSDHELDSITLHAIADVRVALLDQHGAPLVDTPLVLLRGGDHSELSDFERGVRDGPTADRELRTDHEGLALFEGLQPGPWILVGALQDAHLPSGRSNLTEDERRAELEAWLATYTGRVLRFELREGERRELSFQVQSFPRVSGRVPGFDVPPAGASVVFTQVDARTGWCSAVAELPLDERSEFAEVELLPVVTQVALRVPGLGAVSTQILELRLGRDEFLTLSAPPTAVVIELLAADTLAPLEGASVHLGVRHDRFHTGAGPLPGRDLVPPEAACLLERSDGSGRVATSDRHGRFVLRGLRPGEYSASFSASGYAMESATFDTSPSNKPLRVLLEPAISLRVTTRVGELEGRGLRVEFLHDGSGQPAGSMQVTGEPLLVQFLRAGGYRIELRENAPGKVPRVLDTAHVLLSPGALPEDVLLDAGF